MSNTVELLETATGILRGASGNHVRLYLIVRRPKPGAAARNKMLDKHVFKAYTVELDSALQYHLLEIINHQIQEATGSDDFALMEYETLSDDVDSMCTLRIDNRAVPFVELITDQLSQGVDIERISSLGEIADDLWAYSIGIVNGRGTPIYTFRKASKGRVAINKDSNPDTPIAKRVINAVFNTASAKLEEFTREIIKFDGHIDCLYIDDQFFVFQKKAFESIVGLNDMFLDSAYDLIDELNTSDTIIGLDKLKESIESSVALLRRVVKIAKAKELRAVDEKRIKAMKAVAESFEHHLRVNSDGKIEIESKEEVDLLVKLLADYFLVSEQTGAGYGSFAKTRLK